MSTNASSPVVASQIGPSPSSQRPSATTSAVNVCMPPSCHGATLRGCASRRSRPASSGNAWKNWLFVRVETDDGLHGYGEGTVNGFAATVAAAIEELSDQYLGADPHDVEALLQRMVRDVYSDGGQIHMAAAAAIEIACWDIVGKAAGLPVHALLGGRVRDRVRAYANGWYRTEREPEAVAAKAREVVAPPATRR